MGTGLLTVGTIVPGHPAEPVGQLSQVRRSLRILHPVRPEASCAPRVPGPLCEAAVSAAVTQALQVPSCKVIALTLMALTALL